MIIYHDLGVRREGVRREREKEMKILFCNNNLAGMMLFRKEVMVHFLKAGFDDYMTKPINGGKLETLLMRYLPEEKVVHNIDDNDEENFDEDKFLERLCHVGLNIDQGITNCGSVEGYKEIIEIYLSSLEGKAQEIERFYNEEDYDNYTIQVHSLKSTSKVIGADMIADKAYELEMAGDMKNINLIKAETAGLLEDIRDIFETLKEAMTEEEDRETADNKEELPVIEESMLADAYGALSDFAISMDYENAIFVLDELKKYKLPDNHKDKLHAINAAVENLDWDEVTMLLG